MHKNHVRPFSLYTLKTLRTCELWPPRFCWVRNRNSESHIRNTRPARGSVAAGHGSCTEKSATDMPALPAKKNG